MICLYTKTKKMVPGDVFTVIPIGRARGSRPRKEDSRTKREAQAWEREELLKQGAKLDMTFESFYDIYSNNKKARVKESTWEIKGNLVRTKILPYFGQRKIAEITPKDVIAWQNELLKYRDEKASLIQENI